MALIVTTGEGLALTTRSENIKSEGGIGFKHQEVFSPCAVWPPWTNKNTTNPKGGQGRMGNKEQEEAACTDSPRLSLTSRRREIGRKLEELGSREKGGSQRMLKKCAFSHPLWEHE